MIIEYVSILVFYVIISTLVIQVSLDRCHWVIKSSTIAIILQYEFSNSSRTVAWIVSNFVLSTYSFMAFWNQKLQRLELFYSIVILRAKIPYLIIYFKIRLEVNQCRYIWGAKDFNVSTHCLTKKELWKNMLKEISFN